MFLRSTVVKSAKKKLRYWKLVENYATERGTRQRVVAHLGNLENFSAVDWQLSLIENGGKPAPQNARFEIKPTPKLAKLGYYCIMRLPC